MEEKKTERRMANIMKNMIMAIYETGGIPERALAYSMAAINADTDHEINIDLVNEYFNDAVSQIGKL